MKSVVLNNLLKVVFILCLIALFYICTSFRSDKKKDCDVEALLSEGVSKLKAFTFVKDFPFSFKEKKKNKPVEQKKQIITLNSGVKYKFLTVSNTNFEGKAIVSIYNNEKQDFLIASSYNQRFQRFYDEITFECKSTGNYCLALSFHEGLEGCGMGIMAFLP